MEFPKPDMNVIDTSTPVGFVLYILTYIMMIFSFLLFGPFLLVMWIFGKIEEVFRK